MIQTHLQPLGGAAGLELAGTLVGWVQEIGAPWSAGLSPTAEILEEPWQRAEREQATVYG
ncbi:MAG: hypothetical protein KY441_10975 [Actinobacteria bacterium]|nr:hypothetical protein [Actinomycetota bacterium]